MPETPKGEKIKSAMQEQYGSEKGEQVFFASKNKGTIKGVDTATRITHTRSIPGLGTTTVTHANDGDVVTGALPVPERHKDLLGEVSKPETTPRGPMTASKPPERVKKTGDVGASSTVGGKTTGYTINTDSKKKSKDQSSTFLPVQSGAPMNNLGMGIPAPNVSAKPGVSKSTSTAATSTGDSLRSMNNANRAFWARKR